MNRNIFLVLGLCLGFNLSYGQKKSKTNETKAPYDATTISDLKFRMVGPALTSGRIADIKVHPDNANIWYVAAAAGGVWKTDNHGTSFTPIFDNYGSFSIGCIELAPSNPNTIWVGTGENNNQRSVSYGDGVYRSLDGGKSFTNMGLKSSEHIGEIIIHPTDENTVWVAAYGPVWSAGGERGVYKTTNGGKTWERTLFISEHTGIADLAIDPKNPNTLYASAHQRRRREWTYIGGGPESTLYKSTDGGLTWKKIEEGLPKNDMGKIGIAVSPVNENYIYAIVEARLGKGGFFKSTNKGESWTKMSSYKTSGNYYQEIICDLTDENKVFAMDTWLHHTTDGGKNFIYTGEDKKHVDNHTIWIDPKDGNHWIVGCDGGIYETYNHAKDWKYYDNLPIIQFYKVTTDNDSPFYNIYGGTQDNNSMGGPSATINNAGILNSDWYITNGGDGFESAIDPTNPNVVYAQSQYGGLVRFDKSSGEKLFIQPIPMKDEAPYRWNWDSPLLISPHDHNTIYFAANKVFKSENRGDDWSVISPDLSQQMDRNKLKVMGQVWGIDAVMKNASTTIYGNVVALDESPIKKGFLIAGTDDGLIQISENGGNTWSKTATFPGVPANTRVNMVIASKHNENTVYAIFNNHRSGDFKPYILKSTDKGKTWTSISGDLPKNGAVYCIQQDHIERDLLFAGTEYGVYTSTNAGVNWTKLSGLPTIAVYDLAIQERESDLVAATFGRGFYVLDNYSPLRNVSKTILDNEAYLFPIKDALIYVPTAPLGLTGVGSQGGDLWNAENPIFGATFSFYLKETNKSLIEQRREKEKALEKEGKAIAYPSYDELKKEELEGGEKIIFIIKDETGSELKRIITSPRKGITRVSWNLRMETTSPIRLSKPKPGRYSNPDEGLLVTQGKYTVEVVKIKEGKLYPLIAATPFNVVPLNNHTFPVQRPAELMAFRKQISELKRSIDGSSKLMGETKEKITLLEHAILNYPNANLNYLEEIRTLDLMYDECTIQLWGDQILSKHQFETKPSIYDRVGTIEYQLFETTCDISKSQKANEELASEEYANFRLQLNEIILRLTNLEKKMADVPIPYTKGGNETWK